MIRRKRLASRGRTANAGPTVRALRPIILILALLTATPGARGGAEPFWIWHAPDAEKSDEMFARRQFHVSNRVRSAELLVAKDANTRLFLNGQPVTANDGSADVTSRLRLGRNVLATHAKAAKRPGFIALLVVTLNSGQRTVIATDREWKISGKNAPDWTDLAFDDSAWKAAAMLAPHGAKPWGKMLGR